MHQTSQVVWLGYSYTHISYSLFWAKRAARYMNSTLNAMQLIPCSFIHCQAKRAAKYMNSTLNAIQLIPCSFLHWRAKRACSFGQWLKVAMHSVVALKIVFTKFGGCGLARRRSGNCSILLSVFFPHEPCLDIHLTSQILPPNGWKVFLKKINWASSSLSYILQTWWIQSSA